MNSESPTDAQTLSTANPWLLPVWLVVRPGLFFRAWGQRAPVGWLIAACWFVGTGSMASSVLNRMRTESLPIEISSWTMFWIVIALTGVLRGAGVYGLGGLWFRARLWMSGERSKCWGRSTRVYIGGRIVEGTIGVVALVFFSLTLASPEQLVRQGHSDLLMLAGLGFVVWGGMVAFLGARAVFSLNAWAWLWLFAVPMLWRLGLLAVALFVLAGFPKMNASWSEPEASIQTGQAVSVAVDNTWSIAHRDDGADAANPDGTQAWSVWILPKDDADTFVDGQIDVAAETFDHAPAGRWGNWRGDLRIFDQTDLVPPKRTWFMVSDLDAEHALVLEGSAPIREWDNAFSNLERCMASVVIVAEGIVDTGLFETHTVGPMQFELPANWIIWQETHGPSELANGHESFYGDSPGLAYVSIIRYRNEATPTETLERLIGEMDTNWFFDRKSEINTWHENSCSGAIGTARTTRNLPFRYELVVLTSPDGQTIEIVARYAQQEPEALRRAIRSFGESVRFSDPPP